jgi:hypothetical protein
MATEVPEASSAIQAQSPDSYENPSHLMSRDDVSQSMIYETFRGIFGVSANKYESAIFWGSSWNIWTTQTHFPNLQEQGLVEWRDFNLVSSVSQMNEIHADLILDQKASFLSPPEEDEEYNDAEDAVAFDEWPYYESELGLFHIFFLLQ